MKKSVRFAALALALTLVLALTPALPARAANGVRVLESGLAGSKKLTVPEIARLFAEEAPVDPGDLYASAPDLTAPYEDAGAPSRSHLDAALKRLNDLRALAGLAPVALRDDYTRLAQAAAYTDALLGQLTHTPGTVPGLASSVNADGQTGAGRSNIAWYSAMDSDLASSVDLWIDDTDTSNIDRLGHRRWALNPAMAYTGFGFCQRPGFGTYTAMYAFDRSAAAGDYDFIAWPASGNFPTDEGFFQDGTAWSVTLNPQKFAAPSPDDVTVTVTGELEGETWTLSGKDNSVRESGAYFNVETSGYGVPNCIIFRPDHSGPYEGSYTVTVSGLKTASGADGSFSYTVTFFDLQEAIRAQDVSRFTDLDQAWMLEPVRFALAHGVMNGTGTNIFQPNLDVDLGTALTVMARLCGVDTSFDPAVPNDWMRPGMTWGRANGLTGSTDGTDGIPRQELIWMLWCVAGQPAADEAVLATWPDANEVAPTYREALAWAVDNTILTGDSGRLLPSANTQRVQLAALVQRAHDRGFLS